MPTTPYNFDIARNLDYLGYVTFAVNRSLVYTGDVSSNLEVDYDNIVWSDPVYGKPSFSTLVDINPQAYEWDTLKTIYANPDISTDVADLKNDVSDAQAQLAGVAIVGDTKVSRLNADHGRWLKCDSRVVLSDHPAQAIVLRASCTISQAIMIRPNSAFRARIRTNMMGSICSSM